jgi:hypothetical protein
METNNELESRRIMKIKANTVADLMEHLSQMDKNEPLAYVLWLAEDVEMKAEENNEVLTADEISDVLARTQKYHDCEYGITWDTINDHMIDVINEREDDEIDIEICPHCSDEIDIEICPHCSDEIDIEICPHCSMEMIYSIDGDTCLEEKWSCPNCDWI